MVWPPPAPPWGSAGFFAGLVFEGSLGCAGGPLPAGGTLFGIITPLPYSNESNCRKQDGDYSQA